MTLSDRVVVMDHGEILQSGSPSEVYEFPRTRFVSELAAGFLRTTMESRGAVAGSEVAQSVDMAAEIVKQVKARY